MKKGFSLLEMLVVLVILGLLMGAVLALTQSSARLERNQRALALLSDDLSLTATVLAREVYLAGYRMDSGIPLTITTGREGDAMILRFLCDEDMELYCSSQTLNAVRRVGYRLANGTLYWGACRDEDCADFQASHPAMEGVEAFRLAYQSGGNWSRASLTMRVETSGNSPKVEMVALYLLARSSVRTGVPSFIPGSRVEWSAVPEGTALRGALGIETLTPTQDGYPRAERLVVVQTPNLAR